MIPDNIYNSVVKLIVSNVNFDFSQPFNKSEQTLSIGTGFMIDAKHLVTAAHVVKDSYSFIVNFPKKGKTIYQGEIVCVYPDFDLALLALKNSTSDTYIPLGDSDKVKIGDSVYALGYPDDSQHPLNTKGTISGIRDDKIQTDAALNQGNSGGPLLDKNNHVIGINSSIFVESDGAGFAVPINFFKNVKQTMVNCPSKIIFKPSLGITIQNINQDLDEILKHCEVPTNTGIIIKSMTHNSPLRKLNVHRDDIILKIDNKPIDNFGEINVSWYQGKLPFSSLIKRKTPGDQVKLSIFSKKEKMIMDLDVTLGGVDQVMPIRQYFPYIETIPYEIFGSLVFMNFSLNHFEEEKYLPLTFLLLQNKLNKGKVIITHQFPNSSISHYNIINVGQVVQTLNNLEINNITDLRNAMKYPLEKNGKLYFKLITEDGALLYLELQNMENEDLKFSKQYNFKLTKGWQKLYQTIDKH